MGEGKLSRGAIVKLFTEDRDWLMRQSRTLERDHIRDTLDWIIRETESGIDHFEGCQQRAEQAETERDELRTTITEFWRAAVELCLAAQDVCLDVQKYSHATVAEILRSTSRLYDAYRRVLELESKL